MTNNLSHRNEIRCILKLAFHNLLPPTDCKSHSSGLMMNNVNPH